MYLSQANALSGSVKYIVNIICTRYVCCFTFGYIGDTKVSTVIQRLHIQVTSWIYCKHDGRVMGQ